MEQQQKCSRNGCKKSYNQTENTETSCNYHPGKPIFHDFKKGWTCCNQIVYDWDEFQKIPTCTTGAHCSEGVDSNTQSDFFKSDTVSNAQRAIDNQGMPVKVKNINDYNKEQEKLRLLEEEKKGIQEKQIFKTEKGLYKCINKGCLKEFDPKDNTAESCKYHAGEPVFHDLKKFWTCCKKETWDWDEFMKIPTCTVGLHQPKYI